jgi:hypothetical protein
VKLTHKNLKWAAIAFVGLVALFGVVVASNFNRQVARGARYPIFPLVHYAEWR